MVITQEVPEHGSIRSLDLNLAAYARHVGWQHNPRANKPVLPYHSAHSSLVNRGIVRLRVSNALSKSCLHAVQTAFDEQVSRIQSAGHIFHLVVSVTEGLLRNLKSCNRKDAHDGPSQESERKNVAVAPYIHGLSQGLKRIADRVDAKVALSAPHKLVRFAKETTKSGANNSGCHVKHRTQYVPCVDRVVDRLPLRKCGSVYVRRTGRYFNDRLREQCQKKETMASLPCIANLGNATLCLKCAR